MKNNPNYYSWEDLGMDGKEEIIGKENIDIKFIQELSMQNQSIFNSLYLRKYEVEKYEVEAYYDCDGEHSTYDIIVTVMLTYGNKVVSVQYSLEKEEDNDTLVSYYENDYENNLVTKSLEEVTPDELEEFFNAMDNDGKIDFDKITFVI